MTELSTNILKNWQVRKHRKQKTAFIEYLKTQLPGLRVEKSVFGRNLVLGDVDSARLLLTAHYDTCARLPFPNFITPKNGFLYIGYQLLITIPFLLLYFAMLYCELAWGLPIFNLGAILSLFLVFFVFLGPIANPHTANDNTSGVITLCEIWAAMTEEERQKVCIVFFDNEENGLLGSMAFALRHKKDHLNRKPVLNFDCVSDGDHILFAARKAAEKRFGKTLFEAFPSTEDKTAEVTSKAIFPSDQSQFRLGVGVCALKYRKGIGLYMNRIHTVRDTVFAEKNIRFLTEGTLRLIQKL